MQTNIWGPDLDGLKWMTFAEAVAYIEERNRTDTDKWRLPTFKELDEALYDRNFRESCCPSPSYWTSDGTMPGCVWTIFMGDFTKLEANTNSDTKCLLRLVKVSKGNEAVT